MGNFDEKTRVTQVVRPIAGEEDDVQRTDCLVVIYTKEPTLLGKRFVLDESPTRVGRGTDNQIVLDGDSVSRRHAHFESRGKHWIVTDDGSIAIVCRRLAPPGVDHTQVGRNLIHRAVAKVIFEIIVAIANQQDIGRRKRPARQRVRDKGPDGLGIDDPRIGRGAGDDHLGAADDRDVRNDTLGDGRTEVNSG